MQHQSRLLSSHDRHFSSSSFFTKKKHVIVHPPFPLLLKERAYFYNIQNHDTHIRGSPHHPTLCVCMVTGLMRQPPPPSTTSERVTTFAATSSVPSFNAKTPPILSKNYNKSNGFTINTHIVVSPLF